MIPRFLNWQGIAGLGASLALAVLFFIQKLETSRWKTRSGEYEQLYRGSETQLAVTLSHVRAAAEQARAADRANAARVAAEQRIINERTANDFEDRLAAARAHAERLHLTAQTAADPGAGRATSMPELSAGAGSAAQAARQDRLPPSEALIATEQAIQLDELIKWVRAQSEVRANPD